MLDISHLQYAMLGFAMIRPVWSANGNDEPDDPDPATTAAAPPWVKDAADAVFNPEPSRVTGGPPLPKPTPRAITNKHVAKVYHLPRRATAWRTYVQPHKQALEFALWMVKNGHTEPLLADEVDDYMLCFCDTMTIREPDYTEARSILAGLPGVDYGRRRIKNPRYDELRQRTTIQQPTVYQFTKQIPELNALQDDAMTRLTRCGTAIAPSSHVRGAPHPGQRVQKPVSQNKKTKKRVSGRAKKPTKPAHYLDDKGWGLAA